MATPAQIEDALKQIKDQESFIQRLLVDALDWPIDEKIEEIDRVAFEWSADDLRAQGLIEKDVQDGRVYQIQPFRSDQPWGIFLLQFQKLDHFGPKGGMSGTVGTLRKVLRGLVPNRRKNPAFTSWQRENLLFICTHNYQQFRFAYFKAPRDKTQAAPMSVFGWNQNETHLQTLCKFNLPALGFPDRGTSDADWVAKWAGAFDVEAVTKRFFEEYAAVFAQVEERVKGVPKGEARRLYTQRLFNRLMFLYFIQRKGWLSFNGDKKYLRALYTAAVKAKEDFLNDRLYWTFFHGLNSPNDTPAEYPKGFDPVERRGDVPFLNGGLFEALEDDYDVKDQVTIPNAAFGDILDLFDRYNFTVSESTPLDIEVAVDPEMLGKVFEELVTGRHESGSYYTPRPIVSFMCREALKHYLQGEPGALATGVRASRESSLTRRTPVANAPGSPQNSPETISRFVDDGDPSHLRDPEAVLDALRRVKVCDPACGSGAYLLGMMQELLRLREKLSAVQTKDAKSVYDRKLEIIQNNLYGVDIDLFAVNIAKLRLWLSLAVDYEGPKPPALPNLDFKIECGDSLTAPDPQKVDDLWRLLLVDTANILEKLKDQFLTAHTAEKTQLRKEINRQEEILRASLPNNSPKNAVDWRIAFAEVFRNGGFDVVIANPPYVRKESIRPEIKDQLRENFGSAITGRSDLYCSFYARGVQLLRPNGVHVFICSNAWLDAGYGADLQRYLLANTTVCAIYDSAVEKQFSTANVNTIISLFTKGPPLRPFKTKFVLFTAPFPPTAAWPMEFVETDIEQEELHRLGTTGREYTGDKWGGKYLRAPRIYKRVFGDLASNFVSLTKMADVDGYIHDNNTGEGWRQRRVIWSVKDARTIRVEPSDDGLRRIGVKEDGNSTTFAPILFARTFGTRHLVLWMSDGLLGKEFYKIQPHNRAQTASIVLQLNSTLGILQREVLGIRGLGGGAIKFAAADVGLFQLLPALNARECESALTAIARREMLDIDEELEMPDRRSLDSFLFDRIGLDSADRESVYEAVSDLVKSRHSKSRKVTAH